MPTERSPGERSPRTGRQALAPTGRSEERAQLAHLLRRTGFGATAADVDAGVARGYQATVAVVLGTGADAGAQATPAARSALVAAPVEYVVGAYRSLGLRVPRDDRKAARALLGALAALGQVPFRPPGVGGWPGGAAWLSTAATRARLSFALAVAGAADLDAVAGAAQRDRPDAAARLLGIDGWTARTRAALLDAAADPPRLVTLALVSPEYVVR